MLKVKKDELKVAVFGGNTKNGHASVIKGWLNEFGVKDSNIIVIKKPSGLTDNYFHVAVITGDVKIDALPSNRHLVLSATPERANLVCDRLFRLTEAQKPHRQFRKRQVGKCKEEEKFLIGEKLLYITKKTPNKEQIKRGINSVCA